MRVSIEKRMELLIADAKVWVHHIPEEQCFMHDSGEPGRIHLYERSSYERSPAFCVPDTIGINRGCEECEGTGVVVQGSGNIECWLCQPA